MTILDRLESVNDTFDHEAEIFYLAQQIVGDREDVVETLVKTTDAYELLNSYLHHLRLNIRDDFESRPDVFEMFTTAAEEGMAEILATTPTIIQIH